MTKPKYKEFWIKITSFDKVEMGGFRYSDAEISIDPKCGENYDDFKNAVHAIEYNAFLEAATKCEEAQSEVLSLRKQFKEFCDQAQEKTDADFSVVREYAEETKAENEKLKKQVEILKKACEFYAVPYVLDDWNYRNHDAEDVEQDSEKIWKYYSGVIARKALKEIEELK